MKKKKFLQDENALSEVLGFVLIMGIVLTTTTIYLSIQTPEWTKDYESRHADEVADDFSEQDSLIDGIVLIAQRGGEIAAGTTPIKMSPDKVPIFGMTPPGSRLNSLPDDESFVITPTVEGASPPPPPDSKCWEQNKTTGFDYTPPLDNVVITASGVELARQSVTYPNRTIDGTSEIGSSDPHFYNYFCIINGGTLYVGDTGRLTIYATSIFVDSTSEIYGDWTGHRGGLNNENGAGDGRGFSNHDDPLLDGGGGGAGYGGDGGNGSSGLRGSEYGNSSSFLIQLGSGGGGGSSGIWAGGKGGDGGGAIWLEADEIIINGTVTANGQDGSYVQHAKPGGGGGSGGGILLYGNTVAISGTISVDGGDGVSQSAVQGGGGAGGRIKIFYGGNLNETEAIYQYSYGTGKQDGTSGTLHNESKNYSPTALPYVSSGTFISAVHDTTSDYTCYGEMTWNATLNGQTIVMKVRTDMFSDMRAAPDWLYCPEVSNGTDISELSSVADGHQFIQYCAELSTEDTSITPVLDRVRINYNLTAPGGGSPVVANSSGILKFNSHYLYYPNQEIVYEHGAVIKCQGKGEGKVGFMLHLPPIDISANLTTGAPEIEVSMIDLTGSDHSYSGSTTTSVENSYTDYNILSDNLKFPNLTLNLTTEYPYIWGDWFNKTLEKTTLTTPDNYTVSVNATTRTVAVEFYGHGDDGVQLYLEKTAVEVKI